MEQGSFSLRDHVSVERDRESPDAVLVDGRSGILYSCNPVGALLVESLRSGTTLDELVTAILHEFDVTPQRATADVRDFVESLHKSGLLTDRTDSAGAARDTHRLPALA